MHNLIHEDKLLNTEYGQITHQYGQKYHEKSNIKKE